MAGGKFRAASDAALANETGAARWIGLLSTLPTREDGTGMVEVSDANYARQAVAANTDWNAVTTAADNLTRQTSINADKSFPAAAALFNVKGWALFDAVSAGNKRRWGPIVDGSGNPVTGGQDVAAGTTFILAADTVVISEA